MIKEVWYKDMTTDRSDYSCEDGELALVSGMVYDGGGLTPASLPAVSLEGFEHQPIYKHVTTFGNVNYITSAGNQSGGSLYYAPEVETPRTETEITHFPADALKEKPRSIQAVGNTLIVNTYDGGVHYVVYKDGGYKYLGDHIPEFGLQFRLKREERHISKSIVFGAQLNYANPTSTPERQARYYISTGTGHEGDVQTVTNNIYGFIEDTMQKEGRDKNRFFYPFFVRYALRLYDGSYTNFSAPILMEVNKGTAPLLRIGGTGAIGADTSHDIHLNHTFATLQAKALDLVTSMDGWEDVVKGVDIFVSSQFPTFDTSKVIDKHIIHWALFNTGNSPVGDCNYRGQFIGLDADRDEVKEHYNSTTASYNYLFSLPYTTGDQFTFYTGYVDTWYESDSATKEKLTVKPTEEQTEAIKKNATFYKLCSYNFILKTDEYGRLYYGLEGLSDTDFTEVTFKERLLDVIETQPALDDDYFSHDKLNAKAAYVYNSRLNLANVMRYPFQGFTPAQMMQPIDFEKEIQVEGETVTIKYTANIRYTVFVNENGVESIVDAPYLGGDIYCIDVKKNTDDDVVSMRYVMPPYFFYPNPNAYKVVANILYDSTWYYYSADLKPHPLLNGAYVMTQGDVPVSDTAPADMPAPGSWTPIPYPNLIYTSKPYNPYVFAAANSNELGGGISIIALVSNTQPLSQGQAGQFPLYVFTDKGIWALEVDKTGTFLPPTAVTRDVILGDGESLTQLDDSLVFATEQGIMELVGKTVTCLSESLEDPFNIDGAPTSLYEMLYGCHIAFDYANQRIVVFNPESEVAYVYSGKTQQWSCLPLDGRTLLHPINSYPQSEVVTSYEDEDTEKFEMLDMSTIVPYLGEELIGEMTREFWTRPISLDAPNDFKLVDVVRQNGVFNESTFEQFGKEDEYEGKRVRTDTDHVLTQTLYGSNDLVHWTVIAEDVNHSHIRGTTSYPYKFFKLHVVTNLQAGESLSSVTFSYRIKHDNEKLF